MFKPNIFRQGDLCFKQIEKLPKGLKKAKDKVVAYGKITGHSHRFEDKSLMEILVANNGLKYLNIIAPSTIIHEEHRPILIEKGIYQIINEQEFDYFESELRKVVD